MKIKDIIRTLIESGEDFSDHGMTVGANDEIGPRHSTENCDFCAAWRAAEVFLTLPMLDLFDKGDEVVVVDRHPGIVEDVILKYRVRLGERMTGEFAPEFVKAPGAPNLRERYVDAQGDMWERDIPSDRMLCVADGSEVSKPSATERGRGGPGGRAYT